MELTQTTYTSSWVPGADGSQFPIQNLPYGIFSHARSGRSARPGVAIGDAVLDLCELSNAGLLDGLGFAAESVFSEPTLNAFMARSRRFLPAYRGYSMLIARLVARFGGTVLRPPCKNMR